MHEVKAIIRPQRLDQVMQALREIPGLPGVTVSTVHAYGGARPLDNPRAPNGVQADFSKLEIIVPESLVDATVSAIGRAAHTGRAGDGLVMVIPVERFERIRDLGTPSAPTD
jgi:nitrogen regulatory protein P-II 1